MNARGKSDGSIVPMSPANNGDAESSTEPAEGRVPARRNTKQSNLDRTPKPAHRRSRGLYGVREPAQKRRKLKFTNLLHHISVELLTSSFYQLKKKAAVGIDRVSWHEYEQDHEDRSVDLHGRIHRGAFRATPSKRVYIEKADGRKGSRLSKTRSFSRLSARFCNVSTRKTSSVSAMVSGRTVASIKLLMRCTLRSPKSE